MVSKNFTETTLNKINKTRYFKENC